MDALFRLGMHKYFDAHRRNHRDAGYKHFEAAAAAGHMESRYFHNILNCESPESIEKMSVRQILQCRNKFPEYVGRFWIQYERVQMLEAICWCAACGCSKPAVKKKLGWPNLDVYDYVVCSDACIWALEGILLCGTILENYNYYSYYYLNHYRNIF